AFLERGYLAVGAGMVTARERRKAAAGEELDFLPAALEIEQRPPSPGGRAIGWTLMLCFVAAVAWATLGSADIVAVAKGRIVPDGRNKLIQPLEMGSIKAIHVNEGQHVARGQHLLELDDVSVRADLRNIRQELSNLEQEYARLCMLDEWLQRGETPSEAVEALPRLQRELLLAQWRQHQANLKALQSERRKREAEQMNLEQQVRKLEATLPLVTKRAQTLQKLSAKRFLGEAEFLEMEQQRLEMAYDLASNRKRADEIVAALTGIDAQREQARRRFHSQVLLEQQENRKRVTALQQERIKASTRLAAYTLYAPVAGVVQQLSVHTLGGIVTPAQQLMTIIPDDGVLEVEALVENRDIGFVREGQRVEVKIDAFPFTRYGIVEAVLTDLSNDAIADERKGLVYRAKVTLKENRIRVDRGWVNLSPGMTVSAEVKTGKRRLIEFFLAPLLRYRQESIRER
ncbi:MAG: HlyD family type I secretion periplasmic adaptor subunit, partial [Gammaproteobacteria bacterium]|nr:HlyD family type I secretion periplasmic adaptor subunit [Gammaproteobacteria bacterium]